MQNASYTVHLPIRIILQQITQTRHPFCVPGQSEGKKGSPRETTQTSCAIALEPIKHEEVPEHRERRGHAGEVRKDDEARHGTLPVGSDAA